MVVVSLKEYTSRTMAEDPRLIECLEYIEKNKDVFVKFEDSMVHLCCGACDCTYKIHINRYKKTGRHWDCYPGEEGSQIEAVRSFVARQGERLVSETYVNTVVNLDIECSTCWEVYAITLSSYLAGHKHLSCSLKKKAEMQAYSYEYVRDFVASRGDTLLSETYRSCHYHLDIKCGVCLSIRKMTFGNYKHINSCRTCASNKERKKKTLSFDYVRKIIEDAGDELLSDVYVNYNVKLKIRCGVCSSIYDKSLLLFTRGIKCHCLSHSKGEAAIKHYLDARGFRYIEEKRFPDCKDKNTLPFDFYLLDYNIIVEYDGSQHFTASDFFGEKAFVDCRQHDIMKTAYCYENSIYLLRIDYTQIKNIPSILDVYLEAPSVCRIMVTSLEKYDFIEEYVDSEIVIEERLSTVVFATEQNSID